MHHLFKTAFSPCAFGRSWGFQFVLMFVVVFCISCRSSSPFAGKYTLEGAPLKIEITVVLKPDGHYDAISKNHFGELEEQGTWSVNGEDLILLPTNGSLHHPVRKLRPDTQRAGYLLWIVQRGQESGAVSFFSFKPVGR